MNKIKTIKLQGNDYAQVKDRIIEFREANPRGSIVTEPIVQPDGYIIFKAKILKDKSDEFSAESTGHAYGQNKGAKAFEKLESIAVGRALALLGYGTDGSIASSEEMEEFENFKKTQYEEEKSVALEALESAVDLNDLKAVFEKLGAYRGDADIVAKKEELKHRLTH